MNTGCRRSAVQTKHYSKLVATNWHSCIDCKRIVSRKKRECTIALEKREKHHWKQKTKQIKCNRSHSVKLPKLGKFYWLFFLKLNGEISGGERETLYGLVLYVLGEDAWIS